jgi:signal transduction histidine kinase/ActR/RegA family two-component response regulator
MNHPGTGSLRVLVLAPTGADAEITANVLAEHGVSTRACDHISDVCECMEAGAGALLLAEEALFDEDAALLTATLAGQDLWSDIPIILLTSDGEEARWSEALSELFGASGNLTLVERPCRTTTLTSCVQVALRARRKQYEARDLLFREQQARRAASEALDRARQSEIAREELLDSERAARAEAETANRLKDEFLASLSHELRTPLSVILSWSRILMKKFGTLDAQLCQGLSIVTDNAMTQAQLISDLLDMSRIISGKISLEPQPTELTTLVTNTINGHRPSAEAKNVAIELERGVETAVVRADSTRLQQVFWNLLSNAIKFTPGGGCVHLAVSAPQPGRYEVCVRDSGEGIAADFLPNIFDRFRQADGSTSRRHGGLGLGLAITKQLVEMHGGEIAAYSEGAGHGATFIVSLPAHDNDSMPAGTAQGTGLAEFLPDSLSGIRVLAVEDQPQMLDIVRRVLEEYGADVAAVGSGQEALELLRARANKRFDVLVSDIGMPKLDGYALLRSVRTDLSIDSETLPAIAITAFARPEDRQRLLAGGFQAHLTKPYQVAQLVCAVQQLAKPLQERPAPL